jgi:hypothetical protein
MAASLNCMQMARDEINKTFGPNFAEQHPEVVVVVVQSAASDWAAARLAIAIERVAEALLVEEEAVPQNGSGIVRANGLVRP